VQPSSEPGEEVRALQRRLVSHATRVPYAMRCGWFASAPVRFFGSTASEWSFPSYHPASAAVSWVGVAHPGRHEPRDLRALPPRAPGAPAWVAGSGGCHRLLRPFAFTPGTSTTGRAGPRRDAAVVLGNTGTVEGVPVLARALADPEPLAREHAIRALARLDGAREARPRPAPGAGGSQPGRVS
jgi:hypothetical protein